MDASSKHGVIIMTFGTLFRWMPQDIAEKFMNAFREVKQTVIWRIETDDEFTNTPPNVHIFKWIPQTDLLAHPNAKLFITHGGKGGQMEAVVHAVPMIAFPHIVDQMRNAKLMVELGLGMLMHIKNFTSDELTMNIKEVLTNEKYKKNIDHRSAILADQPMTGAETAAYWIEHVIKFGGGHLKSHALDMAWYEFYMFDILALIALVLLVVAILSVIFVMQLWKQLCTKKSKQD